MTSPSWTFEDHVVGAQSDSGLQLAVDDCVGCGEEHHTSVNTLGRFAYSCRGKFMTGQVANWDSYIAHLKRKDETT